MRSFMYALLEWKEPCEAVDALRCRPGSSSETAGSQSIGCIRSSNCEEGLNFHLRMSVQTTATPTIQEATAITTMIVVWVEDEELDEAAAESVPEFEGERLVRVTV